MTANTPDTDRRMLPRWRTAATAVALGELKTSARATPPVKDSHFDELLAEWKRTPTLETAAEVVSSAWSLNRLKEAESAARLLAKDGADVSPLLRDLSSRALSNDAPKPVDVSMDFVQDHAKRIAHIAAQKRRVRRTPRNAIAWMDLAHAHTVVGQKEKAERAVRTALALAPENRFVLRSAVRFLIHCNDKAQAIELLRRSSSIRHDPWIMSAEIALSSVMNMAPRAYKRAREIVDADALDPWQTGELHGALGTLAMTDRGVGKARKFFLKSLRHPTENAVAQAQWAVNGNLALEVPPKLLTQDHAFEALALKARNERRWKDAIAACRLWSAMEPTSTRPLNLASFIAEVALNDGPTAIEFTERMRLTVPDDSIALNNHIVALAYAGDQKEAEELFERLARRSLTQAEAIVRRATEGLLAFRRGDAEAGEQLYLDAFERSKPLKDRELSVLVVWHLIRESARIGAPGVEEATTVLWKATQDIELPELHAMHDNIRAQIVTNQKQEAVLSFAARKHLTTLPSGHLVSFIDKETHE